MNIIIRYFPVIIQNIMITIYNCFLYRKRHRGIYKDSFEYYSKTNSIQKKDIEKLQEKKLKDFLDFVTKNSNWYGKYSKFHSLYDFPILTKTELISNITDMATIDESKGIVSYTGGTTGSSLKVIYTESDMQERFAILDSFRSQYGYHLGKKVAWFSGKEIISSRDLNNGTVFRDDYINKIRFFSTFHISEKSFFSYWEALNKFSPEFIVGFPSSVYEICTLAKSKGLRINKDIKIFFPTAETVLPMHRNVIEDVLGCKLVDQYASSEGAPFILECKSGNLHMQLLSGFFEILDQDNKDSTEGELVVTSFTTHGTPLVRYKIGDRIKMADSSLTCSCGSPFPIVKSIDGRTNDYIESSDNGKVNLGNISNSTKGVEGIIKFQIIQKEIDKLSVMLVVDENFDDFYKNKFNKALRARVGKKMSISFELVNSIPTEKSGKFRIVKRLME